MADPSSRSATERLDAADELLLEQAAIADIGKAHNAYLEHTRQVAAGLAAEAAEALEDGIRDIVDEDAEADAAVQAVLVRQISERAMYAARRVADLEAQGDALAFGKTVAESGEVMYIGRRTVFDGDESLLVDWRARAAIPFYRATSLEPMSLRQRRHLIYADGADSGGGADLVDYSDEIFDVDQLSSDDGAAGLRGEAALLATLVAPTGEQMRSVVATIQAEQDAVIRAAGNRMLIVQGGPGTGKTVVALHRAAYLLYDQRVDLADTGVLIVGPSNQFLHYISGVLPSLGESGVVSVTVPRLYRGVRLGATESDAVADLKSGEHMVPLLAAAIKTRQRKPQERFVTWYGSRRVVIDEAEIKRLFARATRQVLHNDGAALFRRDVIDNLVYQVYDPAFHNLDDARASFEQSEQVTEYLLRHFPSLTPEQALNDLLGSKALLATAAAGAGLEPERFVTLHQPRTSERRLEFRQWSNADAALLDELLARLGPVLADGQRLSGQEVETDEAWVVRDEADEFELAEAVGDQPLPSIEPFERARTDSDLDGPAAYDDPYFDGIDDESEFGLGDVISPDGSLSQTESGAELSLNVLASEELEDTGAERERTSIETALAAEGRPAPEYDGAPAEALDLEAVDAADEESATVLELAGQERSWQFGHVIVDEAQDLTPMQWRMVARRSSGGALTVVGDLAQRVGPAVASWAELVPPSLSRFDLRQLTINYRSPAELDPVAGSLLSEIAPELPLARSLRWSGHPPRVVRTDDPAAELVRLAEADLAANPNMRIACIVPGESANHELDDRIAVLTAREAKGLEFDAVYLLEPAHIAEEDHGLNLLYVAVTRATQALTVVHAHELPSPLARGLDVLAEASETSVGAA